MSSVTIESTPNPTPSTTYELTDEGGVVVFSGDIEAVQCEYARRGFTGKIRRVNAAFTSTTAAAPALAPWQVLLLSRKQAEQADATPLDDDDTGTDAADDIDPDGANDDDDGDEYVELYSTGPRTQAQAAVEIGRQMEIVQRVTGTLGAPPFYAAGTELLPIGKDQYRVLAREYADLPPAEEAAHAALTTIRAEQRENVVCNIGKVDWTTDGGVLTAVYEGKGFAVETPFLRALCTKASDRMLGGGALLSELPADIVADVLNERLHGANRRVQFRTRVYDGVRRAFAVVGPEFPSGADADQWLAETLGHVRGQGMRGSVVYDPSTTEVQARFMWGAPQELDAKVGDVFRAGWSGASRDNGTQSFRGGGYAERIRCINCTVIVIGGDQDFRKVHKGTAVRFLDAVAGSMRAAVDGFQPFADAWGIVRSVDVAGMEIDGTVYTGPDELMRALADSGYLGVKGDTMYQELTAAWAKEPGEDVASVLNAITRASHEAQAQWDAIVRRTMEERAGELLYVYANGEVAGA